MAAESGLVNGWLRDYARGQNSTLAAAVVTVSHLCLVPTILWAWRRRRTLWIELSFFVSILFWSCTYHACYSAQMCFLEPHSHQLLDHFFAQMACPVLILYIGCVDQPHIKGIYLLVVAQVDVLLLWHFDVDDMNNYLLVSLCGVIVLIHLVIKACRGQHINMRFDPIDAFFGFALGVSGMICYKLHGLESPHYWLSHGIWHCLSFVGSYFVFESRNPDHVLGLDTELWKAWYQQAMRLCGQTGRGASGKSAKPTATC